MTKPLKDQVAEAMGGITAEQKAAAAVAFAAELPDGKRQMVDVKRLHESDRNLRKTFTGLVELKESIESLGRILVPLLVRPHPDKADHFEIVGGARRFRAGKLAKLTEFPVDVVKMTDAQVDEVMLVENCQREGLHAMEEAEGYSRLMTEHHYTVPQIASKIAKSKSHVFARLKLLSLCPEARKAFRDDLIHPTVAVPLARIKSHKHQAEALNTICPKGAEPMSSRAALDFLQTKFCQTLKGAPFDLKDEDLHPEAGSCMKCPYRSGSTPGLFEDVSGFDTCTNTPCFNEKVRLSWTRSAEAAKDKGLDVMTVAEGKTAFSHSNELNHYSPLVLANTIADGDPKKRTWKQLTQKLDPDKRPPLILVPDRQLKGRECYRRDDVLKMLAKDQKWAAKEARQSKEDPGPEDRDQWEKDLEKRKLRDLVIELVIERSAEGVNELRLPELRILALTMADNAPHGSPTLIRRKLDDKTIEKWIVEKATGADLARFIFELALVEYIGSSFKGYSDNFDALAKRLKLDVKAQEKIFADELEAQKKRDAETKAAEDLMKTAEPNSPLKTAAKEAQP